jgi:hypothetical protein
MRLKPQEIASYPANGFEIAQLAGASLGGCTGRTTPENALQGWRYESPPHNDVIVNAGEWVDYNWRAIGAAVHEGHAVVWFGEEYDPVN